MARGMTGHDDEALDIVQDAMMRFANNYSGRPADQWKPLFFRILINRVRDWQRRRAVRARVMHWLRPGERDPIYQAPAPAGTGPLATAMAAEALEDLDVAIRRLPARQQQAFVLRCLEGFDVAATAGIMDCSTGSVKTHYSRALSALRKMLGEHGE